MADKNELMNADLYKPNSHKARKAAQEKKAEEEERQVEKVVTGNVSSRERPIHKKIARTLLADDMQNVKNYIWLDVLIPTIKEAVSRIIKDGADMLIFGAVMGNNGRKGGGFNYHGISSGSSGGRTVNRKAMRDFREEEFDYRDDAEEVLSQLNELIERYGNASVSDFYSSIGVTPKYTDKKWGWRSLAGVQVKRAYGNKYVIDLPRAEALD